jgi:Stage II sporulation protein E (SpoIIE)
MAVCAAMPLLAQAGRQRPAQAIALSAPTVFLDASRFGSPVPLDKDWRVGITANPQAAMPDFDDSIWAVRDAQKSIADVDDQEANSELAGNGTPGQRPFVWFRLHVKLAPNHGPVALLIDLPVSQSVTMVIAPSGPGVNVFANGKQIQAQGPHGDDPQHYQQISRIYNLDIDPSETSLTLALRTPNIPFGYGAYTSFFSGRTLILGDPGDLDHNLALRSADNLDERLPRLVNSILLTVLALFLLALFFSQNGHVEYLWLALYELTLAPIAFVELAGSTARLDTLWYAAILFQLVNISAYLYFEFLVSFLSLRRRWYILLLRWTAPVLAGAAPALLSVGSGKDSGIVLVLVLLGNGFWLLAWLLFTFVTLIVATLRRNFEAGLLLIPFSLALIGQIDRALAATLSEWQGTVFSSPLTFHAGPIPIHLSSIGDFTGLIVIVLIIFVRFLRIQREQEHASSELAAARSVQELLIPREIVETPGFEVDSIYTPANEVGGDFFHVQSTSDGGLLVVIGDVAGHGLKAAMNVSMLMGALRRTPESSPAKILASLNQVLVGTESFTTCQAAWFGADGELVIANAGHLPPYLNSQEVALPGGLPLGFLANAAYEEVRLHLRPGDRLLLLSDGVVEARSSGELFGFDRVHKLSNQSAFFIANAAKVFGQEDDITVLTVRRIAKAMAA